jgi:hypothetical protein
LKKEGGRKEGSTIVKSGRMMMRKESIYLWPCRARETNPLGELECLVNKKIMAFLGFGNRQLNIYVNELTRKRRRQEEEEEEEWRKRKRKRKLMGLFAFLRKKQQTHSCPMTPNKSPKISIYLYTFFPPNLILMKSPVILRQHHGKWGKNRRIEEGNFSTYVG